MELHPLARQFATVAGAYERGRPEYAPAVVGAVAAELGLAPGDRVLDVGAGTGKLTRALIRFGFDVVALEPQPELRDVLVAGIGHDSVRAGVAEEIPLPDGSLAAVTAADAFHWFDRERALEEIRRVLGPGGAIALLSASIDSSPASWDEEVARLVLGNRPAHPHFDGPPYMQTLGEHPGYGEPWELRVTTYAPADPERICDALASMSWIAALPPAERETLLTSARAIIEAGETPPTLPVHATAVLARRARD